MYNVRVAKSFPHVGDLTRKILGQNSNEVCSTVGIDDLNRYL